MTHATFPALLSEARVIPFLERLADEAPTYSPLELSTSWKNLEGWLLAQLRDDERERLPQLQGLQAASLRTDHERIRNLTWEIAVSIELRCVHVRAIHKLAELLRIRAARAKHVTSDWASMA
jgi:hypothetical protein